MVKRSAWADWLTGLLVRFLGLVILVASISVAATSYVYSRAQEADQAERLALQINSRLDGHIAVLEGVRALYQSDQNATGSTIAGYLAALKPHLQAPGMEGVGIAAAMRRDTPATAQAQLRANYDRDILIWPATSTQPIGFPIILVEPYSPRRDQALGFDMYSEPVRRLAMRRAWQTGRPAVTGIVQLAQEKSVKEKQPGFLIYLPVYARQPAPGGRALVIATMDNAKPIEAFVYAPFRSGDLMRAVLGEDVKSIAGLQISAGDGPAAPVVFRHGTLGWDSHERKLRVADRNWTMRVSYGHSLDRFGLPIAILLAGLAVALMATQLHRVQRRRTEVFQALAAQQARHAEERELMMGEMAHRMKNAFARISALARITLREADNLDDFEVRFDGRMRALSDAKQLLVSGTVNSADLGEIVRRELEVVGWSEERLATITGPRVDLDDEPAQAMSLAIHEFATNSIKYGALSGHGDLSIGWVRSEGQVVFHWVESGLRDTPDVSSESFGTQFIRALIERQLKGQWSRTASDHCLTIDIRWQDEAAPETSPALLPPHLKPEPPTLD